MALISRVPSILDLVGTPAQAFEDESGELQPTDTTALETGQGFKFDEFYNLVPTDSATFDNDDNWDLDINGDLQPQE